VIGTVQRELWEVVQFDELPPAACNDRSVGLPAVTRRFHREYEKPARERF
jgi:hypothetical protein